MCLLRQTEPVSFFKDWKDTPLENEREKEAVGVNNDGNTGESRHLTAEQGLDGNSHDV